MNRRGLLAMVHIARKDLGLDEETYRAALEQVAAGKSSAAELSDAELSRMVDHFRAHGWTPKTTTGRPVRRSDASHVRKVWAIWGDMCKAGIVRTPTRAALRAFVERMTGRADPEWLTPLEANRVIEGLKAWREREQAKPSIDGEGTT